MSLKFEINSYRPLSTLFLEDTKSIVCNDEGIAIATFSDAATADKHLIHWRSLGYDVKEIKADQLLKK